MPSSSSAEMSALDTAAAARDLPRGQSRPVTVFEALASVSPLAGGAPPERGYQDERAWILARSNVISRDAAVEGAAHVSMAGDSIVRPGAVVRGDLARIRIGRYSDVGESAVLRPAARASLEPPGSVAYVPQAIGSHARIGRGALVEAAALGVGVRVGARAVVGKSVVLKDYCARSRRVARLLFFLSRSRFSVRIQVVAADAVVPDDLVCAPFSVLAGVPARVIGTLSPAAADECRRVAQRAAASRRRADA